MDHLLHMWLLSLKLVKIPDSVENPEYCLAEPLGCISNMVRTARPEYGDFVAVIGCGTMGLLTLSALKQMPLQGLIAIDLQDSRLEWAKDWELNLSSIQNGMIVNNLSKI